MAEKLKGISLSIGLETSDFKLGLTEIKRQITLATDAVKFWKQQLKIDPSNTVYLQNFNRALEELTDISQEAKDKVKQVFDEFTQAGASPSDERVKSTVRELNSLDNTLNKAIPNYREFANTIQNGNGDLEEASNNLEQTGDSASRLGDIIKGNLISDAIKYGIKELVNLTKELAGAYLDVMKNGIEYNANMEKSSVSLHAIGEANGETKESIDKLIGSMKELGAKSSFGVDTLLEVSQQLMASGVSAEETGKDITNLAKILAYAGKSGDELKRMAQNLNQIKNAGKAMAVDLKQFAYSGVPVYKLLADYSDEFKNITKDTVITYDDLVAAFSVASEEGSQYFNAIEIQAQTYAGQLQILKNNWDILTGLIAEDATQALANHLLPAANEALEAMQKGFQEGGWVGMLEGLVDSVDTFADDLAKAYPELEPIITTLKDFVQNNKEPIENFLTNISDFVKSEEFATLVECVSNILTDVIGIVDEVIEFMNNSGMLKATLDVINGVLSAIHFVLSGIKSLIQWINDNGGYDLANEARQYNIENYGPSPFTGGFVHSGGFGALQSGGYGNITLNASFVANGNLDESQAKRFASLMVAQINEELGNQL
ncbi:MAG: hypothetical protein KBT03_11505 [Bacteroidales bacterium]|nr:hypothetical protein [Candidatus Scybalousia scybalohippi]